MGAKKPPPKRGWAIWGWTAIVLLGCGWFLRVSILPPLPKEGDPPLLYSNQCRTDLYLALRRALEKTQRSVFLVMFGLSDSGMISLLSQKAAAQLKETIYYDPQSSPNVRSMLPRAEVHPIRGDGLMHHKIIILDDETVFLGSTNMTPSSLRMHDNLVIGFTSRAVAHFLLDHLPTTAGHLKTLVGGQPLEIWLLPDPRGHALGELRTQLRTARHTIRAALFTLTHPLLVDDLITAHRRGADVSVVVDQRSGLGAGHKAVEALQAAGVRVRLSQGAQLMHHKFVWIDDDTLVTGSANWTKAAFCKNNDCLVTLSNLTAQQKELMKLLWTRIDARSRS